MSIRKIDFFTISRANGDCAVLLLSHPGPNLLGRYLPRSKVNDLLFAEQVNPSKQQQSQRHAESDSPQGDVYMDIDELEADRADTMDLATFLE